jgi:hypothetical protein
MTFLVGNKKRFIATIVSLSMAFVLTMIWAVVAYMYMSNEVYKEKQSQVIAEQYKLLYENDRKVTQSIEPLLDKTMERVLLDVSKDIKSQKNIDINYLKHLTNVYGITGIWLIEGDKVVHLSSEGMKLTDATQWYKDRPEVEWQSRINWLLENEGAVWIDGFSKRNTPPHSYYKWGYMGLGEVPELGGKVILEIGLDVKDAFSMNDLKIAVEQNKTISDNILSSEIVLTDPQKSSKDIKEYQKIKNGIHTTSIKVEDFDGYSQILIKTHFPEKQIGMKGIIIISIASSLFTLICLGLLLVVIFRKNK